MVECSYRSSGNFFSEPANPKPCGKLTKTLLYDEIEVNDLKLVARIRENAAKFARTAGVSAQDVADIQFALGEALTNAIKHGSRTNAHSKVAVTCCISKGNFVVIIADQGEPFDEHKIPEPDLSRCPECGLGIFMMRLLMDNVEYTHSRAGNKVTMLKKLAYSA